MYSLYITLNVISFTLGAPKRDLTFLEIFYQQKHFCEKIMEKCWSQAKKQLSFKYFVNFRFIYELF